MLNWIAYWLGELPLRAGRAAAGPANKPLDIPISDDIVDGARLPVFWGDAELQGLHIGFFVAIAALVVFWVILNRTTLGYEVRAVGYNPAAARYGGISVARNYFLAMAISGAFAGLAGGARHARLPLPASAHPTSRPRRSASSGSRSRCSAGTPPSASGFAAFLFGGAAVRHDARRSRSGTIDPSLAGNLTEMIQGLVVLFVGADVLILSVGAGAVGCGGSADDRAGEAARRELVCRLGRRPRSRLATRGRSGSSASCSGSRRS